MGVARVDSLEEHPMFQAWQAEKIEEETEEEPEDKDTTDYLDTIRSLDGIRSNINATWSHWKLARSLSRDISNARDFYISANTRMNHIDNAVFNMSYGHYALLKIVHDIDIRASMPSEYQQETAADMRCESLHSIVRSYQSLISDCDHKFSDIIIDDGVENECVRDNCYAILEDKKLGIADTSILANGCKYLIELHYRNSMMEERIQVAHQKLSACLTYIRTGLIRLTT